MSAIVGEFAAEAADSAVRIRLTQALAELPPELANDVLRRLAHDADPAVARVASALVAHRTG
jgi:HEAT repeat protein